MSQILDSMSQSAVVSYPQVLQQLSTESSEEAKDSQVNAILSQGLKQSAHRAWAHRLNPLNDNFACHC